MHFHRFNNGSNSERNCETGSCVSSPAIVWMQFLRVYTVSVHLILFCSLQERIASSPAFIEYCVILSDSKANKKTLNKDLWIMQTLQWFYVCLSMSYLNAEALFKVVYSRRFSHALHSVDQTLLTITWLTNPQNRNMYIEPNSHNFPSKCLCKTLLNIFKQGFRSKISVKWP